MVSKTNSTIPYSHAVFQKERKKEIDIQIANVLLDRVSPIRIQLRSICSQQSYSTSLTKNRTSQDKEEREGGGQQRIIPKRTGSAA